ncbi:hypothetical protein DQ04_07441010 [Trypanosoma grayi]|uniref:hypothetical protein n=1 Tax=Trypanosoma grayi TaxID=71804 RepID=UPI0004F481BE|nr:hypothetical protein DQ04_07441010 [Trypanosoma grayi]KEG08326.1 hypothetical protein DQ04_07441010 [Trypanosoma grayi]
MSQQARAHKAPHDQTWIQAGHRETGPARTARRDEPALSCPALKSLRCHFTVDGGNVEKLWLHERVVPLPSCSGTALSSTAFPDGRDVHHAGSGIAHSPL